MAPSSNMGIGDFNLGPLIFIVALSMASAGVQFYLAHMATSQSFGAADVLEGVIYGKSETKPAAGFCEQFYQSQGFIENQTNISFHYSDYTDINATDIHGTMSQAEIHILNNLGIMLWFGAFVNIGLSVVVNVAAARAPDDIRTLSIDAPPIVFTLIEYSFLILSFGATVFLYYFLTTSSTCAIAASSTSKRGLPTYNVLQQPYTIPTSPYNHAEDVTGEVNVVNMWNQSFINIVCASVALLSVQLVHMLWMTTTTIDLKLRTFFVIYSEAD